MKINIKLIIKYTEYKLDENRNYMHTASTHYRDQIIWYDVYDSIYDYITQELKYEEIKEFSLDNECCLLGLLEDYYIYNGETFRITSSKTILFDDHVEQDIVCEKIIYTNKEEFDKFLIHERSRINKINQELKNKAIEQVRQEYNKFWNKFKRILF